MLYGPHDLDAALDAHELAELARLGAPRLLDRACARRLGGAGIRRGLRGPNCGRQYLESYALASAVRASEAAAIDPRVLWAWYDLVTPWLGNNVARILPDGSILIEPASTQLLTADPRDTTAWSAGSGVTVTPGDSDGPDGASNTGTRQELPSGGFSKFQSIAGLTALATYTASIYLRRSSGGGTTAEGALEHTSTVGQAWGTPVTISTTWARYVATAALEGADVNTSVVPLDGRAILGMTASAEDATHDLMQLELGAHPTSPIRGAGATRALDDVSFAAANTKLLSRPWAVDVSPLYASDDIPANAAIFGFGIAGSRLELLADGTVLADVGGVNKVTKSAITFSRYQPFRVTVNPPAGSITVVGATTGDGTTTGTAWTWAAGSLQVGDRVGGGAPFGGVISRPWAA